MPTVVLEQRRKAIYGATVVGRIILPRVVQI
jgi:hypothetical protein